MTLRELIDTCEQQIEMVGNAAIVVMSVRGRCNASMTHRFPCGGPVGRIQGEDMTAPKNRILVSWKASELLAFLDHRRVTNTGEN